MKKVIALLLVFVMVFFACSCGKKGGGETETEKYVFKSSETQKVYKNANNYMIIYYKDEKISGIDTVMTFQTEEAAKSSLEVLKKSASGNSEIVCEGKYVVMHMSDEYLSDYLKMTNEGVESFLKGQGYVLVEKVGDETTAAGTTAKKDEKATTKAEEKKTEKPEEKSTKKAAEKTTQKATTAKPAQTTAAEKK